MKIKLSKSQWEIIGKKTGWIKKSQTKSFIIPNSVDIDDPNINQKIEEAYFNAWEARKQYNMGEHMIINPSLRDNIIGRAWLRGWNDSANGKPKQIPKDLLEYVKSDLYIKIQ